MVATELVEVEVLIARPSRRLIHSLIVRGMQPVRDAWSIIIAMKAFEVGGWYVRGCSGSLRAPAVARVHLT